MQRRHEGLDATSGRRDHEQHRGLARAVTAANECAQQRSIKSIDDRDIGIHRRGSYRVPEVLGAVEGARDPGKSHRTILGRQTPCRVHARGA